MLPDEMLNFSNKEDLNQNKRPHYFAEYRSILKTSADISSKKSSAHLGVRVNSVLTRNGCIKCYISLFKDIILQHLNAFQTGIQGSLTKLCRFKTSKVTPQKW